MSEPLRLPWDGGESKGREIAPSTFRPRRSRDKGPAKVHATRPATRREAGRPRPPSVSAAAGVGGTTSRPSSQVTSHASRGSARDRTPGRVVQGPQRERHEPDYVLLAAAVALSALGILMVYSSSGVDQVMDAGGTVLDAVLTQLGWGLLGAAVLATLTRLDYRYWRRFSVFGLAVSIGLLVLVLLPPIPPIIEPVYNYGATRWLRIGGLPSFHPAEFAKLGLIVFMAHWLTSRGKEVASLRAGLLPFLVIVGIVAGLVIAEPDLGTTGVIVLTAFAMFFVAGGSLWQLLLVVPLGVLGVAGVLALNDYQRLRWETFLQSLDGPCIGDQCYQSAQGMYALALGGVSGQGLGQSQQPGGLSLPAANNDFIFALLGQEFGLIGGLTVIGLFLLLTWRGLRVAMSAPDPFGGLLALGITAWLAFQAFINIGVVVVLIPLTGMTLPFFSDGGSSLVVTLAAVGILLSVSRETIPRGETSHADPHRGRGHRRPHLPGLGRGVAAGGAAG